VNPIARIMKRYIKTPLKSGNPLEDITILTEPEESLALLMKDGKSYKNTL
jgi:hypothetical protein